MMPDLLVYVLKLNGALLLLVGAYYALLHRLTFHTLNRWYLLGAVLFSALYPLVDVAALWRGPVVVSGDLLVWQTTWPSSVGTNSSSIDYYAWAMGLYWIGVSVLGARLLMQGLSLRRLHLASVPTPELLFRQIGEAVAPFSFWQTIYLNARRHHPHELPAILQHEQVHVRQWHTLDVLLGQLLRVFCWFNPAAWLLLRTLQENLEFIADQTVLRSGRIDSKQYQYSLVQLSTLAQGPALVTPFTFHTLKNRIKMMNSQKTSSIHAARYLLVAPLLALLLLGSCSQSGSEENVKPTQTDAPRLTAMGNTLYFVDGEKSTSEEVEKLNQTPAAIASVNVLKGKMAAQKFGATGAEGVVAITTKANQNSEAVVAFNKRLSPETPSDNALILIDGRERTKAEMDQLPKSRIKEVNVLKGTAAAEAQYGAKARNGVIRVTTNDQE